jgi:plasmid stabilization system protein ParE
VARASWSRSSPYLLIYEVDPAAEVVRILRIWHGAQER